MTARGRPRIGPRPVRSRAGNAATTSSRAPSPRAMGRLDPNGADPLRRAALVVGGAAPPVLPQGRWLRLHRLEPIAGGLARTPLPRAQRACRAAVPAGDPCAVAGGRLTRGAPGGAGRGFVRDPGPGD